MSYSSSGYSSLGDVTSTFLLTCIDYSFMLGSSLISNRSLISHYIGRSDAIYGVTLVVGGDRKSEGFLTKS